jgi:Gpi18-like mannosyltransferase
LFQISQNKAALIIFVVALFSAEAFLSLWTGLQYDMNIWFKTGLWMTQGNNIYLPNDHIGYPPLWAFWCLISYQIYTIFGNNVELWRFVIKLPMILAQFVLAFVMVKFAQNRFDKKTIRKIFFFALTWIFFIYIGVAWGQLNMLTALLTFLSFYAVTSKRNTIGAILLGLAITLKIFPIIVLPAFLIFILKNQDAKQAEKFAVYACGLPVIFTIAVFGVYQWDILFFLRTIFYWTPVFENTPTQITGGCMNIWSFTSLLNIDIAYVWILRIVWIPVLAILTLYWFRKPTMKEAELNLALISFYVFFMVTYSWVTEQNFLDFLPFVFLQILAYQPKKIYLYGLAMLQVAVFAFSTFNWGPFIFAPLLQQFSPPLLTTIQVFNPSEPLIWTVRGILGLVVSLSLCVFLIALAKPQFFKVFLRKHKQAASLRAED